MLASEGAARFARSQGFETISPEAMMSPRAKLEWEHWKSALSSSSMANVTHCDSPSQSSNHPHAVTTTVGLRDRQDTVGAVAWDSQGAISAGVSSGGLLLKHPGRIGEAAIYGSGCWASQRADGPIEGVACSVSGAGEYIIRAALGKAIGDALEASGDCDVHEVIREVLTSCSHVIRRDCADRFDVGVILLVKEKNAEDTVKPRLWCAFTTDSMAVAYASSMDPKPKALVLRRTAHAQTDDMPIFITALPLNRA